MMQKKLSLQSLSVMSLALILIVFGQGIAYYGISGVMDLFNVKLQVPDIVFWLRHMPYFGLVPQSVGAVILIVSVFKTKLQNFSLLKKQLLRVFVIFLSVVMIAGFAFTSIPMVNAQMIATTGYFLQTPLPLSSMYVGEYSNVSYFCINGSNWQNFAIDPNRTLVESYALGNTSSGNVWMEDAPFNYNLTIPVNVSVTENLNGLSRTFVSASNSQGSPYTISVDNVTSGYYLAQDSAKRFINSWSSTNSSCILNTAIVACENSTFHGGKISVNSGNYYLDSGLVFTYGFVELDVDPSATFYFSKVNGTAIYFADQSNFNVLRSVAITDTAGQNETGIILDNAYGNQFYNCGVRSFGTGVLTINNAGDNGFWQTYVYGCRYYGWNFNSVDNKIYGGVCSTCAIGMWVSQGWGHLEITGVGFGNSSATPVMQHAINLEWCDGATITGCWFEGKYTGAVILLGTPWYGGSGIYITGNKIYDGNYHYGIEVRDVHDWVIEGNIFGGAVRNDVYVGDEGSGGRLGTNYYMGGSIANVTALSKTKNDMVNELGIKIGHIGGNAGIATFSGDGVTKVFNIPHGLASTPTSYSVNGLTNDSQNGQTYVAYNAKIYINLTISVAWNWYYANMSMLLNETRNVVAVQVWAYKNNGTGAFMVYPNDSSWDSQLDVTFDTNAKIIVLAAGTNHLKYLSTSADSAFNVWCSGYIVGNSYLVSANATNIIITFNVAPPAGTNNLQFSWNAGTNL